MVIEDRQIPLLYLLKYTLARLGTRTYLLALRLLIGSPCVVYNSGNQRSLVDYNLVMSRNV